MIRTKGKLLQLFSVGGVLFLLAGSSAYADSIFYAINQFQTIQKLNGDTGAVVDSFAVPFGSGSAASIAVIGNEGYYTRLGDANVYKVDMTSHVYDGIAFNTVDTTYMNGITVDSNNHLWFTHGGTGQLQEFDTAGTLLDTETFPDAAFSYRDGSVVFGGFLVANRGDQIGPYDKYALNPGGTLTYISKPFITQASGNNGIAFNGINFYVSNEQIHRVYKFDINGNPVSDAPLDPNSRYENWTFAAQDIVPPGGVPEPATLTLLGSGLLGLVVVSRRRSKDCGFRRKRLQVG